MFDCRLGDIDAINLFRGEIAATLILSDLNIIREAVLLCVDDFKRDRSSFIKPESSDPEEIEETTTKKMVGKRRSDKQLLGSKIVKRRRQSASEPITPEVGTEQENSTKSVQFSSIRSRARGKGDGLGCTMDCGQPDLRAIVVSLFVRNNQVLLRELPAIRKQVVDYCFLDDYDFKAVEILARYIPKYYISRDDIISMHPNNNMFSNVMDHWSMLLNTMHSDDMGSPSTAFFGIRHSDTVMRLLEGSERDTQNNDNLDTLFFHWDLFNKNCGKKIDFNADHIFVPLNLDNHFFCICINFKSSTIDVLDHQIHNDWGNSTVFRASELMANAMNDFLELRGFPRGNLIANFKYNPVKLSWQSSTPNDHESGCFTMMAMLLYEGSALKHWDLERKVNRRYLVVQLAATLVLADINKIRTEVLEKVVKFSEGKEKIWEEVKARRQIKKILLKNKK